MMPTIFSSIISGELPGQFVYRDDLCVAFMTIEPLTPGHTLVVPIAEVDHWIDLDPQLSSHLFMVARRIGRAIDQAFQPTKVAMMIIGDEVPHVHIHLVPFDRAGDLNFANASMASQEDLEAAANLIRERLTQ